MGEPGGAGYQAWRFHPVRRTSCSLHGSRIRGDSYAHYCKESSVQCDGARPPSALRALWGGGHDPPRDRPTDGPLAGLWLRSDGGPPRRAGRHCGPPWYDPRRPGPHRPRRAAGRLAAGLEPVVVVSARAVGPRRRRLAQRPCQEICHPWLTAGIGRRARHGRSPIRNSTGVAPMPTCNRACRTLSHTLCEASPVHEDGGGSADAVSCLQDGGVGVALHRLSACPGSWR